MAEIADECMLVMVNSGENNNKFYHVTIDADGTITKRWGRVGAHGQTDVVQHANTAIFQKLVAEKTRKGYRPVDVVKQAVVKDVGLGQIAKSGLLKTGAVDPQLEQLVEKLVAINKHEIVSASGGLIKVAADGAVSTPLGMVGLNTITAARQTLAGLNTRRGAQRVQALEEYLTLIPQVVPRARGWEQDFLADQAAFNDQVAFLDQLRDSVAYYEDKKQRAADAAGLSDADIQAKYADLFRYQVDVLDAKDRRFKEITRYYELGRKGNHASAKLKLKRVYTLTARAAEIDAYMATVKRLGNEIPVWHGTRAFNLLSILRKGLFVPPTYGTSITTTGRLFGDGLYVAPVKGFGLNGGGASKSLNYSLGYWGGGSATRDENCFMLLGDAALGHAFRPSRWDGTSLRLAHNPTGHSGKAYNSITVKGGTCNVINDEVVLFDPAQFSPKYICEFDR